MISKEAVAIYSYPPWIYMSAKLLLQSCCQDMLTDTHIKDTST